MAMSDELKALEARARQRVESVADDPEGRLILREEFYDRFGGSAPDRPDYGYGRSELDFLRWEVDRGVLNSLDDAKKPGSAWWRNVNADFMVQSELGALVVEADLPEDAIRKLPPGARRWVEYIRSPSPQTWYRAHNASILLGYRARIADAEAEAEGRPEQVFMNVVLYRLLFAQAMVEGADVAFGPLAEIFANPELPAVEALVDLPDFYPRHYPLTQEDIRHVMERGHSLEMDLVRVLDQDFVLPHLAELYGLAARWNGTPFAERFLRKSAPVYPTLAERQRVAILGGGVGAITAAFALTDPDNPTAELYDVTLYQLGWRLGGKGASGRNMEPDKHHRIQEHGLHIWFGFYDNAFRAMRKAYDELGQIQPDTGKPLRAPDAPLSTWQAAFKPHESGGMFQNFQGRWHAWNKWMPSNDMTPGDGELLPVWDYLAMALRTMFTIFRAPVVPSEPHSANLFIHFPSGIRRRIAKWASATETAAMDLVERVLRHAGWLARLIDSELKLLLWVLERRMASRWKEAEPHLDELEVLRDWEWLNFLYGHIRGILDDRLIEKGFDSINHLDYREWLMRHMHPDGGRTARSALMYGSYDACFAYVDGDNSIPPGHDFPPKANMEAGTTVRAALRLFLCYKGAGIWKMQAGMGDTVFTPYYQVLKARGVKFEFFHRVMDIVPSSDRARVEELVIERQVDITPEQRERGGYDPLVPVNGLPCWPDRPLYDQIVDGDTLEREGIDLEAYYPGWQSVETLRLRVGQDFDSVICGISVGALPYVAPQLVEASPKWKAMVDNLATIPTMGIQLWLRPTAYELGWTEMNTPILSGLDYKGAENPPSTFADMSHLIVRESWPGDPYPLNTTYFTGSFADLEPLEITKSGPKASREALDQRAADDRVRDRARAALETHAQFIYPNAYYGDPRGDGETFRWDLIVDERSDAPRGQERLDSQWFVGNVQPSERYVLTVVDSSKYRLPPNDPDEFGNLYLAGDWIDCRLNYGCVEAATMGGLLCASALCGYPAMKDIYGLDW